MSALGTPSHGGYVHPEKQTSMTQNTSVGSGSRPGAAKVPIPDSKDGTDPHELSRAPAGWLK